MAGAEALDDRLDEVGRARIVECEQAIDDPVAARRALDRERGGVFGQEGTDDGTLGIGKQRRLQMADERCGQGTLQRLSR